MSLFENDEYQWRETYFIFLDAARRPTAEAMTKTLKRLGRRYVLRDVRADEQGGFESLTLISPDDYAAMDIACVTGEEVTEQAHELSQVLKRSAATDEERRKIQHICNCTARLDILHFEQIVVTGSNGDQDDEEEFLDPGSLLIVLERLAELCDGVVVDPQSGSVS